VIHLYLVRRTLAVAMDRAGVAPVDAAPPLATQGRILTMYESTQGVHSFRAGLAPLFDLEPDHVRVISPYGGGGFGSKLKVHAQAVLAAMAAHELPGRAVKVTLTRQQIFSLSGYRPPTIQYARLGADLDGTLTALAVDVVEQSSRTKKFTEGSDGPARMMYAAPRRRTTNRPVVLDVPVPTWMRAPGSCPGMFGLEVAMDGVRPRPHCPAGSKRATGRPGDRATSRVPASPRLP
jgi:xanthine dehydrogenase YagR molybdenum-binding subunit